MREDDVKNGFNDVKVQQPSSASNDSGTIIQNTQSDVHSSMPRSEMNTREVVDTVQSEINV